MGTEGPLTSPGEGYQDQEPSLSFSGSHAGVASCLIEPLVFHDILPPFEI